MIKLLEQSAYKRSEIKATLNSTFEELGGLEKLLKGHKKVLLKPNFVMPEEPEGCSTTHPDFYMSIAEILLEAGYEVGIGESPAFGTCKKSLKFHKVYDECVEKGIKVVEFKKNQSYDGIEGDKNYSALTIAKELNDWPAVINVPKLKVHQQFMFTAAAKNLYGCVTGSRKFYRHNLCANDPVRFGKMVIKNAYKVDCLLHISDGINAMHVKGPRGGDPYPLGKIIVADNFFAHDWLFCHLIGLDPLTTPLFKAVSSSDLDVAKKECELILSNDSFKVAENFKQSYYTDISFSPWHLVRSGWRSLKFKLKRA
ncbi:MAG: DUF362 domain-containing protein [Lentisphaeraceae bacterium]|nr:DUF362 domain-containing protein [Lentisphaeraceae bacterium]